VYPDRDSCAYFRNGMFWGDKAVRTEAKRGCSATASPRPTWLISEKFAAFLRQIAPIGPVLPTYPANKSFAINKMRAHCYLDTVEVRSSSLLVPTIPSMTYAGTSPLRGHLCRGLCPNPRDLRTKTRTSRYRPRIAGCCCQAAGASNTTLFRQCAIGRKNVQMMKVFDQRIERRRRMAAAYQKAPVQ
jgi:hypothetical protein